MPDSFCVILTTTGSRQEAEKIANLLVQRKLAACVQITPITSVYMWKGGLRDDAEFLLHIKTVVRRHAEVEAAIRENHSYEVPEIVQLKIERGASAYLDWISSATS